MRSLPVLAALLGLGLSPTVATAQQAKGPAKVTSVCPGKVLPLQMGNTWTYESVAARDSKGNPVFPPENMTKLLPLRASKVIVTVTAVEPNKEKQETTVRLKETATYDITKDPTKPKLFEQVVESVIVCSPKGKFDISPNSFFFAGEPGGYNGITFTKFDRKKETSLKLINNAIGENEWIEEISAEYKKESRPGSNAQLGGGKLEMERKYTPQAPEGVNTRTKLYPTTEKLGITTSGRLTLDPKFAPDGKPCSRKEIVEEKKPVTPPAPGAGSAAAPPPAPGAAPATETVQREIQVPTELCELPANWVAQLWFADNVGLVQALNPYAHMYQLADAKLN